MALMANSIMYYNTPLKMMHERHGEQGASCTKGMVHERDGTQKEWYMRGLVHERHGT